MFILRVSGDCIREMQEDNNKRKLEYQAYLPCAALPAGVSRYAFSRVLHDDRLGYIFIGQLVYAL